MIDPKLQHLVSGPMWHEANSPKPRHCCGCNFRMSRFTVMTKTAQQFGTCLQAHKEAEKGKVKAEKEAQREQQRLAKEAEKERLRQFDSHCLLFCVMHTQLQGHLHLAGCVSEEAEDMKTCVYDCQHVGPRPTLTS